MLRSACLTLGLAGVLAAGTVRADEATVAALSPGRVAQRMAAAYQDAPPPAPTEPGLLPDPAAERRAAARAAAPAEVAEETPVYRRWWFWALTAGVVGGTFALGAWAVDPGSDPARGCSGMAVRACFGDGRTR